MKLNIKVISIFLVVALILIECYLIVSSAIDSNNQNNNIQDYCSIKCNYDPGSLMWEFSGDTYSKGFTTKEECFSYCSKVRQGFTASLLNAFLNIIKK